MSPLMCPSNVKNILKCQIKELGQTNLKMIKNNFVKKPGDTLKHKRINNVKTSSTKLSRYIYIYKY